VNKLRILPVTAVNDTTEDEGRETIQNNALNWNTSSVSLIPHVFTWRGGRGTWIPSPPTVAVPLRTGMGDAVARSVSSLKPRRWAILRADCCPAGGVLKATTLQMGWHDKVGRMSTSKCTIHCVNELLLHHVINAVYPILKQSQNTPSTLTARHCERCDVLYSCTRFKDSCMLLVLFNDKMYT